MSIRDKFIKLAKQKGSRRNYVKLANQEGLTDKTTPAKKQKNNRYTKAFAKANSLDLEGKAKTNVFKNLYRMKKYTPLGIVLSTMFDSSPANADEIDMDSEDFLELRRQNMSKGGLVKRGKPKRAKKGWK
jgi:hypothetical protein|tara:strand:+ start:117 stop:506 length:390 start_codon:yes stop_codon:yes gene_type:complete